MSAACLDHGPAGLAALVLACWRERGIGPALVARVPGLQAALARSRAGDAPAWRSAARAIAGDAALRLELDQVPGLRSRLWRDGCGGVLPAITLLLCELVRTRQEGGEQLQVLGGTLWIPDHCFPELAYHLELDARGLGGGWERDPTVVELALAPAERADGADGGEARLWRRWRRWAAGAGGPPARRGFLAHAGVVGALPASGLPATAPALGPLVAASRRHPPLAPALALGAQPALVAGLGPPCPLPRRLDLLAAPAHRRLADLVTPEAWRAAFAADPATNLGALLAAHAPARPCGAATSAAALVALVRAAALHAAAAAAPAATGALTVSLPHQPPLPQLLLWADGGRLLINCEGLAGLATWLGLFPGRYRRAPGLAGSWPWPVLEHCGWSQLARQRCWQLVGGVPGAERWMRLPGGDTPTAIPQLPAGCTPRTLAASQPTGDLELFALPG